MTSISKLATLAIAMGWALLSPACASADDSYPTKPVTLIVPFTPASGADILARALAPDLGRSLRQPVVVENRAGASGTIGTAAVARAAPDGHTLLITADTIAITPSLYKSLPYNPQKDLSPVALLASGVMALVVNPAVPAHSISELVALARSRPGAITFASPGNGTPQHVTMELFKQVADIDMLHVPYKGMSGALTDVIGGQVQAAMMSIHVAIAQVNAGKLRLLGIVDKERAEAAPTTPTFLEAGFPELAFPPWFGVFAPASTPLSIATRLNAEMSKALAGEKTQESLRQQGLRVWTGSPELLASMLRDDQLRWAKVIAKARIVAE